MALATLSPKCSPKKHGTNKHQEQRRAKYALFIYLRNIYFSDRCTQQ